MLFSLYLSDDWRGSLHETPCNGLKLKKFLIILILAIILTDFNAKQVEDGKTAKLNFQSTCNNFEMVKLHDIYFSR